MKAGDTIALDGAQVGSVTSSDIGHAIGRTLAMGYVALDAVTDGTAVTVTLVETGQALAGTVRTEAFYDPGRVRVRA